MTTLEITLIIIGVVFLIGSFLVKDKLSQKDLDKIADMSAQELKIITEKELKTARASIDDALDEEIASKTEETKRELEKMTNSKIMAINEYSDTVLDSINKAHNEIMFLYSMLNDKHDELTQLSNNIEKISAHTRKTFEPLDNKDIESVPVQTIAQQSALSRFAAIQPDSDDVTASAEATPVNTVDEEPESSDINHNNDILSLHKSGESNVEIAKKLGLGMGEVKLVIDLYEEGNKNEA